MGHHTIHQVPMMMLSGRYQLSKRKTRLTMIDGSHVGPSRSAQFCEDLGLFHGDGFLRSEAIAVYMLVFVFF